MEEAIEELPILVVPIRKLLRLLVPEVLDIHQEGIGLLEDEALPQESIEIKGNYSISSRQWYCPHKAQDIHLKVSNWYIHVFFSERERDHRDSDYRDRDRRDRDHRDKERPRKSDAPVVSSFRIK